MRTETRFEYNDKAVVSTYASSFRLELQPSGSVLVSATVQRHYCSRYLDCINRDRLLTDHMYGGRFESALPDDLIAVFNEVADRLRERGNWDAKYAPGSDFTGHDIYLEDGLNDLF